MTGLSALIGSWNTIERCSPRRRWSSVGESVSRLRSPYAGQADMCRVERAGGDGMSPAIVLHVTLLPQPLSPTRPRISPLADGERHTVDRPDDAGVGRDVRAEVIDLQHGRRGGVSHRA